MSVQNASRPGMSYTAALRRVRSDTVLVVGRETGGNE